MRLDMRNRSGHSGGIAGSDHTGVSCCVDDFKFPMKKGLILPPISSQSRRPHAAQVDAMVR